MLWLELIFIPTKAFASVVRFTEFVVSVSAKPDGAVLLSVTVSLPLDPTGRGWSVRIE
jgi:hypothetical protein